MTEARDPQSAMPAWLAAGAPTDALRPEEVGAWLVVDALGLLVADGARDLGLAAAPLQVWSGPDLVVLDYGCDPHDPALGLRLFITPEVVEFRLPLVSWREGLPVIGSFLWQRVAWKKLERAVIADLARQALATGRSARRTCTACGRRVALGRYVLRAARVVCFGCDPGVFPPG